MAITQPVNAEYILQPDMAIPSDSCSEYCGSNSAQCRDTERLTPVIFRDRPSVGPDWGRDPPRILVVLDLDETLVCSDILPGGEALYTVVRPHAREMLHLLVNILGCDICIASLGTDWYVRNVVATVLDPFSELISNIYTRSDFEPPIAFRRHTDRTVDGFGPGAWSGGPSSGYFGQTSSSASDDNASALRKNNLSMFGNLENVIIVDDKPEVWPLCVQQNIIRISPFLAPPDYHTDSSLCDVVLLIKAAIDQLAAIEASRLVRSSITDFVSDAVYWTVEHDGSKGLSAGKDAYSVSDADTDEDVSVSSLLMDMRSRCLESLVIHCGSFSEISHICFIMVSEAMLRGACCVFHGSGPIASGLPEPAFHVDIIDDKRLPQTTGDTHCTSDTSPFCSRSSVTRKLTLNSLAAILAV